MLTASGGRRLALALGLLLALDAPATARAETITRSLGIPCTTTSGGVQQCTGTLANRVPSWDGVPLDTTITYPPADRRGPFPLVIHLHGWGFTKETTEQTGRAADFAQKGYAVLAFTARGFGLSCGLPVSRTGPGCARGWTHIDDARYEVRDAQYLAGLLVDEGRVKPRRIGATGPSYGGGASYMLATLRDRVMLPSGRLVAWRSPRGKPMEIAAAAPLIGFSDLAYALVPNGRKLDFRTRNPYGRRVGVPKQSYLMGLYTLGQATGNYAPRGADPDADINNWYDRLQAGEPYQGREVRAILRKFTRFRSAYYFQDGLPRAKRRRPAPMVIYNGWTDDIFPAYQALTYANKVRAQFPGVRLGMIFADAYGHPRASLSGSLGLAMKARDDLFARYLLGDRSAKPLQGVMTMTQGCGDQDPRGPFVTRTWRAQHPGAVRLREDSPQRFTSAGGDATSSALTDPFGGNGSCRTTSSQDDPGAATYRLPPARGNGYTLMGAPTIRAVLRIQGEFPQVVGRLWDVDPGGQQTLVSHGIYRPPPRGGRVTFQLDENGWKFAAGHVAKLELLGRDYPYARPSDGQFSVQVRRLRLVLPIRQRSERGRLERPARQGGTRR